MRLVEKGTSLATLDANRANAQKSTGPTSERGKSVVRNNARKWGRAERLRPLMRALGEDPGEFEAVLADLRRSLAPSDEFEEILVTDMAEIHWRLRRLILAETASRAEHRVDRQVKDDEQDARQKAGKLHELEPFVAGKLGLVWLHDSPVKFEQIIDFLQQVDEEVQQKGFQDAGPAFLQCLYGNQPGYRGLRLITAYEVCLKEERAALDVADKARNQETENAGPAPGEAVDVAGGKPPAFYRGEFHKLMADEIGWFKARAARHLQARDELKLARAESALELDEKSRLSLINQERLERLFERKWKFLARYRRSRSATT